MSFLKRYKIALLFFNLLIFVFATSAIAETEEIEVEGGGRGAFVAPDGGIPKEQIFSFDFEITVYLEVEINGEVFSETFSNGNISTSWKTSDKLVQGETYSVIEKYRIHGIPDSELLAGNELWIPNPEEGEEWYFIEREFEATANSVYEIQINTEITDIEAFVDGGFEGETLLFGTLPSSVRMSLTSLEEFDEGASIDFVGEYFAIVSSDTRFMFENKPPKINNLTIDVIKGNVDNQPLVTSTLRANLDAIDPEDGALGTEAATFTWLRNGSEIPGATGDSLSGEFVKGDEISVKAFVSDSTGKKSEPFESAPITIVNTPPDEPKIKLTPDEPTFLTPITVEITPANDQDNDQVQSIVEWFFNDEPQTDLKGLTTIGPGIKKGIVVKVKVTSKDDEESGGFEEEEVEIANTPPTIAIIPDQTGKERQKFEVEIPVSDPDVNDTLTFSSVQIEPDTYGIPVVEETDDKYNLVWDNPDDIPHPSEVFVITLEISDGTDDSVRPFNLTVKNVNRKPKLAPIGDDNHITVDLAESKRLSVDVLATDDDGEKLTYQMVSDTDEKVIKDAISSFNATAKNKDSGEAVEFSVEFDDSHSEEIYSIKIFVTDGAGSTDESEITISIGITNRKPTLTLPEQIELEKENIPAADFYSESFAQYASDSDGDTLYFEALASLPEGATLQENGDFEWNYFDVEPNVYIIPIKVRDRQEPDATDVLAKADTITFNIVDENDPPVLHTIGSRAVQENEELKFYVGAHDVDGNFLEFSVEGLPDWATFSSSTLRFIPAGKTTPVNTTLTYDSYWQIFSGIPSHSISDGDNVTLEVTFKVIDPNGKQDSEQIIITVTDDNRKPSFEDVADITVREGEIAIFPVRVSDPDNDKLTLTAELPDGSDLPPEKGILDPETLTFTWDLTDNYDVANTDFDPNVFVIKASDGKANGTASMEVEIDVENVNRPPDVTVENTTFPEKAEGEFSDIPVSADDKDGDTFESEDFSYTSVPELPFEAKFVEGSTFLRVYPTYGHAGSYDITVSVTDSEDTVGRKTFCLTVKKTNRGPIVGDFGTFTVAENQGLLKELGKMVDQNGEPIVSEPDGEQVLFTFTEGYVPPEGLTMSNSGLLTWKPNFEQSAVDYQVEITISDRPNIGEPVSTDTVFNITVLDKNRAPTISVIRDQPVDPNQPIRAGEEFTIGNIEGIDLDGDELTFKIEGGPGQITKDTETTVGNVLIATAIYSWTPEPEKAAQQFTVAVSLTDGRGGIATESFTITVGEQQPPVLAEVEDLTVNEDESTGILQFRLDSDKPQPANPQLKFNYTFELNGRTEEPVTDEFDTVLTDGIFDFSWTPDFDHSSEDIEHKLVVTVTDDNTGFKSKETVFITVKNVNRPPEFPEQGNIAIVDNAGNPVQELNGSTNLKVVHTGAPDEPLYGAFDLDESTTESRLSINIRWTHNGNAVTGLNDMDTVPSYMTTPGDEWKVEVTAVDGFGASVSQEDTVEIVDTPAIMTAEHRALDEEGNPIIDIYIYNKVIFTVTYTDADVTKPEEKANFKVWNNGQENPVVDEILELKSVESNEQGLPVGYYQYEAYFAKGSYSYQATSGDITSSEGSFTVHDSPHDIIIPEFEGTASGDIPLNFVVFDADRDSIEVKILVDGKKAVLDGSSNPMTLDTGVYEVSWKSALNLPDAAGESYTLKFQSTVSGTETVTKTTKISIHNKALKAPFLNPLSSPSPKVVNVKGLKATDRGIVLYLNGNLYENIEPNSNTDFTFSSVKLRDGKNTMKAVAYSKKHLLHKFIVNNTFTTILSTIDYLTSHVKEENGIFTWNASSRTYYNRFSFANLTLDNVTVDGWKLSPPIEVYSGWSNEVEVTVDSQKPEVNIFSPEEIISNRTPEFLAYVEDKNLDRGSIVFKIDDTSKNASYNSDTKIASYQTPIDQPLAQGEHSFKIEAKDKAGNSRKASLDFTINVVIPDKTPPVEVIKSPTGTVRGTTIEITVADSQSKIVPDSRKFELNGTDVTKDSVYTPIDPKSGIISYTDSIEEEGVHKVLVSIADEKKNTGIYEWEFSVDKTGPSAPTVKAINCTSDEEVTVTGISEPGASIKLILNGEVYAEGKADTKTGAYSFLNVPLQVGENTIQTLPIDASGNIGKFSDEVKTFRDTFNPNIILLSPKPNQVIGTLTPLITATITDDCGVAETELQVNDVDITTYDYNEITGLLSYKSAKLPDNESIDILIKAVDSVGNEKVVSKIFFTYTAITDQTPPSIETVSFAGKPVSYGSTVNVAGTTSQLSALVYDTDSSIKELAVQVDGTPIAGLEDDIYDEETNYLNYELTLPSAEEHTVVIEAKDENNNSVSFLFTVKVKTEETTPTPDVSVPLAITKESTIEVTVSSAEQDSKVSIFVNGTPVYSQPFTDELSRDVSLDVGLNEIYAVAVNDVGIRKESDVVEVTRDVEAPSISMESPVNGSTVKPSSDGAVTVIVSFKDQSEIEMDSIYLEIQGTEVTPTIEELNNTEKHATYKIQNPDEGINNVLASASDGVGNASQLYSAFFIVDYTSPQVEIITPSLDEDVSIPNYAPVTNSIPELSGRVEITDVDVNSIEVTLDSEIVPHSFSASDGKVFVIPTELEDGEHTLAISATDLVRNTNIAKRTFEIDTTAEDLVNPVLSNFFPQPDSFINSTALTLLSFIVGDTSSGINPELTFLTINGETFSIGEMLKTQQAQFDNRTGRFTIVLNMRQQLSGSMTFDPLEIEALERSFGVGQNTVSVQTTDKSGNTTTSSWNFTVVTTAPETPVLNSPDSNIISSKKLSVSGSVADVKPNNSVKVVISVNSVSVKTVKVNEDGSFSAERLPLVIDNNTIDAIAIDSAGNQSRRSEAISVFVDQVSPSISVSEMPKFTNQAEISVIGSVTDNSSKPLTSVTLILNGEEKASVTDSDYSFDVTLVDDENTLQVEAIDAAGNKGTSSKLNIRFDTGLPATAPTELNAKTNLSGDAILLNWNADSEAATYNIYRTTEGKIKDATKLTPLATGLTATKFEDFSAVERTTYFYGATSVDAAGNEDTQIISNSPNITLIPPAGGTAALDDGTKAVFGQNAVYSDTILTASISIEKLSDGVVPSLDGSVDRTVTKFFAVGQTGKPVETLNKPITITIPYSEEIVDSAESPKIRFLEEENWIEVESTVNPEANLVTAKVSQLGIYQLLEIETHPWDVKADGVVDIFDLVLVGKHFGETSESEDVRDVKADGVVDIFDLVLIGKHFGEIYEDVSAAAAISSTETKGDITMVAQEVDTGLYEVKVETQVDNLAGFQFELYFHSEQLELVNVAEGNATGTKSYWLEPQVETGAVKVASVALNTSNSLSQTPNWTVLAKVNFKVKGNLDEALKTIKLDGIKFSDEYGRLIPVELDNRVKLLTSKKLRNALLPNYPNPFNPETWIPYSVAQDSTVTVRIYNLLGQTVRKLDIGFVKAGEHISKDKAVYWDGKNKHGERVASGIYFYQINVLNSDGKKFIATRKLVILK